LTAELAERGYWPAVAARLLEEDRAAEAVQLCRNNISQTPELLSARLLYALGLFRTGQLDEATEQFFYVLSLDPENTVALKYLGDIRFASGGEWSAMNYYRRVQQLDPGSSGLACRLAHRPGETTRTITLMRRSETAADKTPDRRIPFFTETIGDLYLSQGHPRLAADVFRKLTERNDHPRIREKCEQAERLAQRKER
jgi:tetratricopeptide (TPR) repeat protein